MGRYCNCLLISFYNSVYYYATYNEIGKKVGAIDLPNDRRVNKNQCLDCGGLAVIAGFFVSAIYLLIVMNYEHTIDLFGTENYYIKLIGFL